MHYVFGVCNPTLTVYYGQILVWFGINFIPQGTIELILREDFEPVRYVVLFRITTCSKCIGGHDRQALFYVNAVKNCGHLKPSIQGEQ